MRRRLHGLLGLGSSLLLAASALGAHPTPAAATSAAPAEAVPATPEEREIQILMDRLNKLNDFILKNAETPQAWRYCLEQGEVMLQIAARCQPPERDKWLKMAVESEYSAAVQGTDDQRTAYQYFMQLPGRLAKAFPGDAMITYAALQEIQADYLYVLQKNGEKAAKEHLADRLVRFAGQYPRVPEAAQKVQEAAQIREALGEKDEARQCYHYLAEHFTGNPLARKAEGALWRLGAGKEQVNLELPLLYPTSVQEPNLKLADLRSHLVVVYFWTSSSPQVPSDLLTLKLLTDRYHYHGLEVVYVNLDNDPAEAREFLSGRLTEGTHVCQKGGLDSDVASRFDLQTLPQAFLVGPDGVLIRHSLQADQLEHEVSGLMPHSR
jgi:hypothetical protein